MFPVLMLLLIHSDYCQIQDTRLLVSDLLVWLSVKVLSISIAILSS